MSTTYNAAVYMEQGATKQVFATGGEQEMRTGSRFDQKSGSSMNLDGTVVVGGAMSFSSASGGVRASSGALMRYETVQIMTTKGSTVVTSFLHGYGISVIRPNGTGGVYRLKRPVKGVLKNIVVQSTLTNKISCTSTDVMFGSSSAPQKFSFSVTPTTQAFIKSGGLGISMVGLSSNVWCITGTGALMGSTLLHGVLTVATAT